MNTENAAANLRYLLTDDLYLLNTDKEFLLNPPAAPALPETPAEELQYMGGNKKHFLVICHYPQEPFMPQAHLKALESTLGRISYAPDDIAIVNMAKYAEADFSRLQSQFAPQKLLVLGSDALPSGLQINSMNATQTIDNMLTLYTLSFNEMMGNKENTKLFWNQIKTF
ncbi:hypothetical protein [Mucilaginibacter lacusdianchii]|uniref:hypothetical protein n=1 Tax=Mucilaginibacter lacusdianchii TaxID=2684211 RepID=UPI00131DC10F|nr:hypothetical protein [Mucilaginibacter sp. JXJ CY 39]